MLEQVSDLKHVIWAVLLIERYLVGAIELQVPGSEHLQSKVFGVLLDNVRLTCERENV